MEEEKLTTEDQTVTASTIGPKSKFPLLKKASELNWVFGVFIVALGVALANKANLGVSMIASPPFIIYDAVAAYAPWLTVGMVEYMFQGTLLFVMCCIIRGFKWHYLLSFLVAFIYGNVLDMWLLIIGDTPAPSIALTWVYFFASAIVTAFGVAFFFRTYLPLMVYELFVAEFAKRFNKEIHKVKLGFDTFCLILSIVLAFSLYQHYDEPFDPMTLLSGNFNNIGLGTIIVTFINAPIIYFWGKLIDVFLGREPLIPKLKTFFDKF